MNQFNRGKLVEKLQHQIEHDIMARLGSIQNDFGITDGNTSVDFDNEVRALAWKCVDVLEDQYYRADRCSYCGKVINPKRYVEFNLNGNELCCCSKDCLNSALEIYIDVIDEEE